MIKLCQRALALLLVAGGVASVASCGGAGQVGEAKSPEQDLSTPDAALAALSRAESDLSRALGGGQPGSGQQGYAQPAQPGHAQPPAASVAPMSPPPPLPSPPEPGQASAPRDERLSEREGPRSADPCATACSALASMERATDHLCGLAGSTDGRCQSARERVKNAGARVRAACPACAR